MSKNERSWTKTVAKKVKDLSSKQVYVEVIDNAEARYAGRPDLFLSGPRADWHIETKLLDEKKFKDLQTFNPKALDHGITDSQFEWHKAYAERSDESRKNGVLVLLVSKKVMADRIKGGIYFPKADLNAGIYMENPTDLYKFLLNELMAKD